MNYYQLLLSFVLFCLPSFLLGQNDTILFIPDITIGDQRLELPFSKAHRTISILTKKDLQNLPVQSLNEALAFLPGVDIRNRGIKGSQADISVRGSTFEQVLIMLNGVKINDPQTGHHSLNIPVPLESIERIELLKGPGSRRYGQNSLAAAINIITRVPEESQTTVLAEAGEYSTYRLGASTAIQGKKFGQLLSASRTQSDGYRYNTDFKNTDVFYQNQWKLTTGNLSALAGYSDRKMGANGFYASPSYRDQYEEIQTLMTNLRYSLVGNRWQLKPSLYWRNNQDEYLLERGKPEVNRNLHKSNTLGGEIHAGYHSSLGMTGIGVEYRAIHLESNNLGNHERQEWALFTEHRFRLSSFTVTPGFNLNYFSTFGTFFYPGIDLGYEFNDQWSLYGNAGLTYRIPTYTDLYYNGPTNIGNSALEPEKAMTYEIGAKYLSDNWLFNAVYYLRDSRDLIDWVKNREMEPWQPQNFYHALFQGLELESEYRFHSKFAGLNRLKVFYNYIDASLVNTEAVAFSRYAMENLRHQAMIGLEGNFISDWSYSLSGRYLNRVNLDDYYLMDLKTEYRWKQTTLFLQISNILNQSYTETSGVPMPGRWATIGVKATFHH